MQKLSEAVLEESSRPLGRGRPRAFNRIEALDKAMRLFWRKGYAATSISDLTVALGIGTKSLYAAFGSKEDLYAEAIGHYLEFYSDGVWGRFTAASTAREAIEALLMDSAFFVTRASTDGGAFGCMVTLSTVGDEGSAVLGDMTRSLRAQLYERVKARLERAVQEAELPVTLDVETFARFVLTLQNGMSIQARDGVSRGDLEKAGSLAMNGWNAWIEG